MTKQKSNIEKGADYEIFINNNLNKIENNKSWLWMNIPESELRNAQILGDWNEYRFNRKNLKKILEKEKDKNSLIDTGCDVLLNKNDKYYLVQCKNYDEKNYVTIQDLAGFFMMTKLYKLDGIVYYTSKLSPNLNCQKPCNEISFIKNTFNTDLCEIKKEILIENEFTNFIDNPFDYQIEAYNIITNRFKDHNRAILQLPCGMGKTLISMKVGLHYDIVIIVNPLKQYCIQNMERFKSEIKYKDYEALIIDSDGTRNIPRILKFIKNNKKSILSVCFKSCDILFEILSKLKNYIIIIDEFHNISKNNIFKNESGMYNILHSNSKILFMSATPRIFCLDNEDDEYDSYEEIFGKIIYKYNMGDAIKNKKICDYELYVPDIKLDNEILINDIKNEIDLKNINNDIVTKCNYLLRGMLETGSRKCIIYVRSHEEAHNFKVTFNTLNEYFALELNVDTILSIDNKNDRIKKLKLFTDFVGFSLLINVEILNECIDKKECDSIFITYPSESKINNIQRICRANRLDINNIHKKSKIFLWCNEYQNDLVDIISHLKEFDNTFIVDKVKILSINNNKDLILEKNKNSIKYQELENFIVNLKIAYTWMEKFDLLKNYINKYKKVPSIGKENENNIMLKNLAEWNKHQKLNFKKKIKMMKYDKYYNLWKDFTEINPKQFLGVNDRWIDKLDRLKEFINKNQRTPSVKESNDTTDDASDDESDNESENVNDDSKLGKWFNTQKCNHKKEIKMFRFELIDGIKKYEYQNIVTLWNNFNEDYKKYLLQNNEQWYFRLNEVKKFLDENKDKKQKTPSSHSKDENIKRLSSFISTQKKNYLNKTQIMKESEIYEAWTNFLEEYKDSLASEDEEWLNKLNKLKLFYEENNKRPNKRSSDKNEKELGEWIGKQIQNSNMKKGLIEKYPYIKPIFEDFCKEYNLS